MFRTMHCNFSVLASCVAAALLGLVALPAAAGDTGGTCQYKGKEYKFIDGVYFTAPDAFDATKKERVLAFTTIALDKVAIGRAKDDDKDDAIREQAWEVDGAGRVQLSLNDDDEVSSMQFNSDGTSLSQSGTAIGILALTMKTADGVSGTFKLEGDDDDLGCNLHFELAAGDITAAVAAAPPVPKGKLLPAGGGEIGKVYMANFNAMRKGDIDALMATAAADTRKQMEAARKEPDFPAMLEMMKAFAPTKIKITGGQDFGNTAELTLEGTDESGTKSTGIAQMAKEGGAWKVVKTSMKSGG